MATPVKMPKLDMSMVEGTVGEWLVANGDQVAEGQPLYMLEADKATEEIVATASGTLSIVVPAGETHPTGTLLAEIG